MTRTRLKAIVKDIRYKPGWTVRVDESGDIEVTAKVPDAYHPSREPVDPPRSYVPLDKHRLAIWSTEIVLEHVADAVQRLENHEFGEWFKYRGRRTFDPHA